MIDYVIIVDTQHTNILINTDRISEHQKIDKNSALICSGMLSDIINIKKIYACPSLLHFEFELNMSSSDDLLSQAHLIEEERHLILKCNFRPKRVPFYNTVLMECRKCLFV